MSGFAHPCPDCGCGPDICPVDSDDFNRADDATSPGPKWVEEIGNFQVTSNKMNPPDTGGVVQFTTPVPTTDTDGYKWKAVINFGSGNGTIRLVVDLVDGDTSSSHYIEIIASSSTAVSMRGFKRTSGSAFAFTDLVATTFVRANDCTVEVCVVAGRITATLSQSTTLTLLTVQNATTLHTGGASADRFCGFETVTGLHSTARIDDVELRRLGGPSDCAGCSIICSTCIDNKAPPSLQVDLAGFAGVLATLNGSYIVKYLGCPAGVLDPCTGAVSTAQCFLGNSGAPVFQRIDLTDSICSAPNHVVTLASIAVVGNHSGSGTTVNWSVQVIVKDINSGVGSPFCMFEIFKFTVVSTAGEPAPSQEIDCYDAEGSDNYESSCYSPAPGSSIVTDSLICNRPTSDYTGSSATLAVVPT